MTNLVNKKGIQGVTRLLDDRVFSKSDTNGGFGYPENQRYIISEMYGKEALDEWLRRNSRENYVQGIYED